MHDGKISAAIHLKVSLKTQMLNVNIVVPQEEKSHFFSSCFTQAPKQREKENSRAEFAHRVQGLQRRRPLDAHAGLRPASGARGGGADPRPGWKAELLHAAGAPSFYQPANAVQADGGKEAAQEELRSSVELPVKKKKTNK